MFKDIGIKLGSIGFAGIVAYGTYNFIQENKKVLNFLTGNRWKISNSNLETSNTVKPEVLSKTNTTLTTPLTISENVSLTTQKSSQNLNTVTMPVRQIKNTISTTKKGPKRWKNMVKARGTFWTI